jgi:hypothetical protein
MHDFLEESLEDIALARAIEEGEDAEIDGREKIFKLL